MITAQEKSDQHMIRPNEVLISKENAEKRLKAIAKWALQENLLVREYIFKDFYQAMGFVEDVADISEEENHHPEILISYNKVKLTLTTHSAGGLTTKDFALAYKIDQLFYRNT